MNTCKIHAGYMQDTSGYVLYRKSPPICIGNPPSPTFSVSREDISGNDTVMTQTVTAMRPLHPQQKELQKEWISSLLIAASKETAVDLPKLY
jgi:hypothetical protein